MSIGIEKINLYAGWLCADAVALATARGRDRNYVVNDVMVGVRSVIPPYEDPVTLAVNAAERMLSDDDRRDIELLIVATESAVDFAKPISTWVHRFCRLGENCRNFEVKHACYGATAALKMALAWLRGMNRPSAKALVISSDLTRPHLADDLDFIGGGCAVAMLVSAKPEIVEIDPGEAGYWTSEIADTFRPTARDEIGDNQASLYSYLDALDGAFAHFASVVDAPADPDYFKRYVYHAPFPGMTFQAHRCLIGRFGITDKTAVRAHFDATVLDGLRIARCIGTAYGASNFVSLISLLGGASDLLAADRIAFFAYGSGCQGEFYSGRIGCSAAEYVRALAIDRYLGERHALSIDEFDRHEDERWRSIDCRDYIPDRTAESDTYDRFYRGKGLLVLDRVKDFRRKYEWS